METVKDMEEAIYNHPDVGLALEVRNAIDRVIERGAITKDDRLSPLVLLQERPVIQ